MSALAPDLFTRRFGDLVEIGRARLRPLAPEWTDHNAHDPGITLMELLAWVAEAQLYSLSRLRRDERTAYAALLGIAPGGTRSATGLIWPDRADPVTPVTTFARSVVIPEDAIVSVVGDDGTVFRPAHTLLWVPGEVTSLQTRLADGRTADHTRASAAGGPAFLPFGERAGRRDVLTLRFRCRDEAGIFGASRRSAEGALWAIGVLAATPSGAGRATVEPARPAGTSLAATFVTGDERVPLAVVSDSSHGLLSTGAILLDLSGVAGSPREFGIELRSTRGFPRPPRVLRLEPNVVPIWQGRRVERELHVATGMPDWSFTLDVPGLRFAAGEEPVTVEVAEPAGLGTWRRRDRLTDQGPADTVFELDAGAGRVTFGNGVNGHVPPSGAQVFASYAVSDGDRGGIARNRKWSVQGFDGTFGINVEPVTGGAPASGWTDARREARRRSRDDHALVSADDIVRAATAIPWLEVARAWVVTPGPHAPRTGAVTLVAMRSRASADEPELVPETARWLDAIRRRLSPRMPLATRLAVAGPRYADFAVLATVQAATGRDPLDVRDQVRQQLRRRLSLVDPVDGVAPRQPGVPVTRRDVGAWIRAADGVARVTSVRLMRDGRPVERIDVSASSLPRWMPGKSVIEVIRPPEGSR